MDFGGFEAADHFSYKDYGFIGSIIDRNRLPKSLKIREGVLDFFEGKNVTKMKNGAYHDVLRAKYIKCVKK